MTAHRACQNVEMHPVTTPPKIFLQALAALACSAWLIACSSSGSSSSQPPPPPADTTPPSVPTGVSATAPSATRVDLSWSASTDTGGAGLAGYRVLRGGTQIAIVNAPATTYSDMSVAASTTYSYTVRAFDAAMPANVSMDSAAANVTTPASAPNSGLDARPANVSCVAPARPQAGTGVQLVRAFPALSFTSPVGLYQAPSNSTRWFVLEQGGRIRSFPNDPAAQPASVQTFLDISGRVNSGGELGLLGMAFHPNWPATPYVYVYYSVRGASPVENRISRFTTSNGGTSLDASSEQTILRLVKNQPDGNHNGGNIVFGPDDFLYIGTGDGGSGGDPKNNAQNQNVLFGKMLRIDVSPATGYAIPAGASGNPNAANAQCTNGSGAAACPEIFAYGLRNPWRWSFDRQTGDLWVGDVGQDAWEEVDVVTRGGNYGWHIREASHCYNPSSGCTTSGLIDPLVEYDHGTGNSVTGGFVYRGTRLPALAGRYVFADFVSSRVFVLQPPNPLVAATPRLVFTAANAVTTAPENISAFGQSNDGELYVVGYSGGLYSLQAATGVVDTIPAQLTLTGCVNASNAMLPASGLIPYVPNAPFWSDGAAKDRWLALPDGLNITPMASGDWDFPNGTVLVKNFRLNSQLIETRLFMRHPDGVWGGYTYEWNSAQTDATRVVGGKAKVIGTQTWIYPSEAECMECHTAAAGRSLGLETAQQNGNLTYPQTGRTANQITTLNTIGLFNPAITTAPASLPAYPDPFGTAGTVAERARSYLNSNCSQCHRPGGPTPSTMDLRYSTAIAQTGICDIAPSAGDLGIGAGARIVSPGDTANSVLLARVNRRGAEQMPPIGTTVIDANGVALLQQWISGMGANCQ